MEMAKGSSGIAKIHVPRRDVDSRSPHWAGPEKINTSGEEKRSEKSPAHQQDLRRGLQLVQDIFLAHGDARSVDESEADHGADVIPGVEEAPETHAGPRPNTVTLSLSMPTTRRPARKQGDQVQIFKKYQIFENLVSKIPNFSSKIPAKYQTFPEFLGVIPLIFQFLLHFF